MYNKVDNPRWSGQSSKNTQTIKTDSRRKRKSEQLPYHKQTDWLSNLNTTRKIPGFFSEGFTEFDQTF